MGIILLVLVLAIILGGVGFAVHVLWWIALAVLVIWLLGFLVHPGHGAGRARWYRWLRSVTVRPWLLERGMGRHRGRLSSPRYFIT